MRTRTDRFLPFALLLPTIAFLTLLIVIPMVQALLLSVMAESGGLTIDNFQRMVADVNFSEAWRNTLLLLILIVPLQVVLALVMALLINSRFRGHGVFLYIYAIPLAISDLAAGILWLAVFTERGYLNSTLQNAGVIDQPVLWLSFDNFAGITIFAFQTFAVVFALAGRNMPVLAGEAYTWYATNRNEHVAAAYAVVVMGLTVVAIVVYLRVLGFREAEVQR
jgi:ABC-type sugar transport system permease subunit